MVILDDVGHLHPTEGNQSNIDRKPASHKALAMNKNDPKQLS